MPKYYSYKCKLELFYRLETGKAMKQIKAKKKEKKVAAGYLRVKAKTTLLTTHY